MTVQAQTVPLLIKKTAPRKIARGGPIFTINFL